MLTVVSKTDKVERGTTNTKEESKGAGDLQGQVL